MKTINSFPLNTSEFLDNLSFGGGAARCRVLFAKNIVVNVIRNFVDSHQKTNK